MKTWYVSKNVAFERRFVYDWYDSQGGRLTNGLTGKSSPLGYVQDTDGSKGCASQPSRLASLIR